MKTIYLVFLLSCIISTNILAQCPAMPAIPDCTGGTPLSDGEGITGDTRIVDNISTDYTNIGMNNATLIICSGTHNITFSGFTGILYVKEGATLTTNQSNIPSGISIYNWGTLNFTGGISINNSSAFINDGNMVVTGNMSGSGATFTNRGNVSVSGTLGDWQSGGGLCMEAGSGLSTTDISWTSLDNWVSAQGGSASCISYSGTASGTNSHPFSNDADLNICQGGSDLTGNGGWGSATVTKPCASCNGILPIKLKSFYSTSSENSILLRWITASEKNNALFELERSQDGIFWEVINTCAGSGNTHSEKFYSYIDNSAKQGVNYYRLKQIDYNGDYTYSYIISDYSKNNNIKIEVFPSPATKNNVIVNITSNDASSTTLNIFNIEGKLICSTLVFLNENKTTINLSKICSFTAGTYRIEVVGGEGKTFIVK